jgi:hypothetical protein
MDILIIQENVKNVTKAVKLVQRLQIKIALPVIYTTRTRMVYVFLNVKKENSIKLIKINALDVTMNVWLAMGSQIQIV